MTITEDGVTVESACHAGGLPPSHKYDASGATHTHTHTHTHTRRFLPVSYLSTLSSPPPAAAAAAAGMSYWMKTISSCVPVNSAHPACRIKSRDTTLVLCRAWVTDSFTNEPLFAAAISRAVCHYVSLLYNNAEMILTFARSRTACLCVESLLSIAAVTRHLNIGLRVESIHCTS